MPTRLRVVRRPALELRARGYAMPRTKHFHKRVGAVILPQAEPIDAASDLPTGPGIPFPAPPVPLPFPPPGPPAPPGPFPPWPPWPPGLCRTSLRPGCYTISFVPTGTPFFGTRYRGTLRVTTDPKLTISADLYGYRLIDIFSNTGILTSAGQPVLQRDDAADTGTIPVYARRSYHSYLKGTGANFVSIASTSSDCPFSLSFDEFVYNQPATGFNGTFDAASTNNASSLAADAPGTNPRNSVTPTFVSAPSNLHLASGDTAWNDRGVDLSADSLFPFSNDGDGATPTGIWEIGADAIAVV